MHAALVVVLFLHYAAALTIFGAAAFRLLLSETDGEIDSALTHGLKILFAILAVSAIAMVMAVAASMGGDSSSALDVSTVRDVLTGTRFGHEWQWHLGIIVLVGSVIGLAPLRRPWLALAGVPLLASLAFVGHAAMVEGGAGDLRRLNQALHLLAAGAWLGGLLPLAVIVFMDRRGPESMRPVLLRFSAYGTVAVALVLITGIFNTVALVGTIHGLIGTAYGWILLVKLALVATMIGFALHNRFHLTTRLLAHPGQTVHHLRVSVGIEIVTGLVVVLAACLLGTLAPPIG